MKRFWDKVKIGGPDECWPWTAGTTRGGYGNFKPTGSRKNVRSNRFVYFLTHGKYPDNFACHTCDNPPCCNPAHVYDGTPKRNTLDMIERGRQVIFRGEACWNHKFTDAEVDAIRTSDKRVMELAKDYGVAPAQISMIQTGRRWKHLPSAKTHTGKQRLGQMNGSAILDPEKVLYIRRSHCNNVELAQEFNISPAAIRAVRLNLTWKEI